MTTDNANAAPADAGVSLRLAARADLAAAPDLHARLLTATGDVRIDASAVEMLTTPALQVLIAAGDALREGGGSLTLSDPSEAALRCLAELGTTVDRIATGAAPGAAT